MFLISICIPTYNRPRLAREAVDSALAQTYRPIDIVVSDDSTTNATERILGDVIDSGHIRHARNINTLGQAGNVNRLFDLAKGELLVLLHDDDLLLPGAVAALAGCFAISPGITAAYGKQYEIDANGAVDEAGSDVLNAAYNRTAEKAGRQSSTLLAGLTAQFPNNGYLLRTSVARKVRYRSDPAVGAACDLDFGLRLAVASQGYYYLDEYTAKYRKARQSASHIYIAHLSFDLLASANLPGDLEDIRQSQMRKYARSAVNQWLAIGKRRSAQRVYLSAGYDRRCSAVGILQAILILCPSGITKWLISSARAVRHSRINK
jgi:glycosyltransferase involved in cell wall biosynthesis